VIARLRGRLSPYPAQFWILFFGQLVSAIGMSLVWPFMTIYVKEKLDVTLTVVGLILAANSVSGLLSQLIGGPIVDRFGRKLAMVVSLGGRAAIMLALGLADSLLSFTILIVLSGLFGSLFQPALNSMVADMVEAESRIEAYGLMRIVSNLGIAIGPAIGGFIATRSYLISFLAASLASAIYFFITILLVKETKPELPAGEMSGIRDTGGYGQLMRDVPFLLFCATFAIMGIAYAQMMTILPVYIKEQFLIPESRFGLIMATNAAMVVLFQWPLTRALRRLTLGPALALGAVFVAVGLGIVAFSTTFSWFLLSMIIVTIGELIFAPSSTAFAANLAPEAMRGRYMGVFGMSVGLSFGMGPAVGGLISDNLGPASVWQITAVVALLSAFAFLAIGRAAGAVPTRAAPAVPATATSPLDNPGPVACEEGCGTAETSLE
jgi:MFS family permease